jgi:undecaprenyl-diphosphatase
MELDRRIFEALYEAVPTWVAVPITHLGSIGGVWVLAAVALIVVGPQLNRRTGAALLGAIACNSLVVDFALKRTVQRVRPWKVLEVELHDTWMNPDGYSFPSGHAATAFAAAWVLGARFPRARWPLLGVATLIALSRVVVGAHWPSDVLVGAAVGSAVGLGVAWAARVRPSAS